MRPFIGTLLVAFAAVFEATFNPQIRLLGGEPDLVFLLVLTWSVRTSLREGMLMAFAGGVCSDLLSSAPLGLTSAGLLLTVFAVDIIKQQLFGIGVVSIIALALFGTFALKVSGLIGLALTGFTLPPVGMLTYTILPTMVYNFVLLAPAYLFTRWVQRRTSGPD